MFLRLNLNLIGKYDLNCIDLRDDLYHAMCNVPPLPGYWDLKGHSDGYVLSSSIHFDEGTEYTPEEVADLILNYSDWDGSKIRVLACSAGRYYDGFAYQLSKILNVNVLAPILDLWVDDVTYELYVSDAGPYGFPEEFTILDPSIQNSLWREFGGV